MGVFIRFVAFEFANAPFLINTGIPDHIRLEQGSVIEMTNLI